MRPLVIYYLLVFYVLFQFGWWAYLLVDLNREVYNQKIEILAQRGGGQNTVSGLDHDLLQKMHERWWMIAGEGAVFLGLLITGVIITRKAIYKEVDLAKQQKNFILSVTHEFKSPLAAIKLNLQTLLRHQFEREKQQVILSQAIQETDRINALVENALMAARLEGHSYRLSREEVCLGDLVREVLHGKINAVSSHPVLLQIDSEVYLSGDSLGLSSVILNLVENAEKYSPEGSPIRVDVSKTADQAILRVTDEGSGILAVEKEKIFEKFYRIGNEDTRKTKGTGLGLFIVKNITNLHHGNVSVMENSPKGSIFELRFPLYKVAPTP